MDDHRGTLRAYACGETSHDVARLIAGEQAQRRTFPAGVFLYERGERRVLFDTGYAPEPWHAGVAAAAYRRLLPPVISRGETIDERLRADGRDPADITHVVLSHLHPDHLGGVRFFPQATFLMSASAARALRSPRLIEGIFRGLLPSWFDDAARWEIARFPERLHGFDAVRPFADDPFVLVDLPGHARGHLGALIESRVLLAGDASWGRDLLGKEHRMRRLPALIGDDHAHLMSTARKLLAAEKQGIDILLSHDRHPTGVDLLASGGGLG